MKYSSFKASFKVADSQNTPFIIFQIFQTPIAISKNIQTISHKTTYEKKILIKKIVLFTKPYKKVLQKVYLYKNFFYSSGEGARQANTAITLSYKIYVASLIYTGLEMQLRSLFEIKRKHEKHE